MFITRLGLSALLLLSIAGCRTTSVPTDSQQPAVCPDIYQPVCAADGNTYSNQCKANAAGQTDFESGECKGLGIPGLIK